MKYCFYCGAVVTRKGVGDHFPIPKRHGGKDTVNCCESCHDMKDRIALNEWPVEWVTSLISDLPNMNRETKLFLGRAMAAYLDAINP